VIVNTGKVKLQEAQQTYVESLYWALFTNDVEIEDETVWGDLTEAAWTGYARVPVGDLSAAAIVAGKSQQVPDAVPVFTNGSGSPVTFYGWALIDTTSTPVIVAAKEVTPVEIAAGEQRALTGVNRLNNVSA
jgi:hemolysin-activating ACP:hemolysin acyltransferase